ncbi:unnamed protein product [Parajaminaea phylloscopi]
MLSGSAQHCVLRSAGNKEGTWGDQISVRLPDPSHSLLTMLDRKITHPTSEEEQGLLSGHSTSAHPPPYEGAAPAPQPSHVGTAEASLPLHFSSRQQARHTKRRRQVGRLATAVVVFALFALVFRGVYRHEAGYGSDDDPTSVSPPPSPPTQDGRHGDLARWSPPRERKDLGDTLGRYPWYSSTANLSLTYTGQTEAVWVHALGSSYEGHISYVADDRLKQGEMSVGIEAIFHTTQWRDKLVRIRTMGEGSSTPGFGIYGHPQWQRHRYSEESRLKLLIHVLLPRGADLPRTDAVVDALSVDWSLSASDKVTPREFNLDSSAGSFLIGHLAVADGVRAALNGGSIQSLRSGSTVKGKTFKAELDAGSLNLHNLEADDTAKIIAHAGSVELESAKAPELSVECGAGSVRGRYAISDSLRLHSDAGSVDVQVALTAPPHQREGQATVHVDASSGAGSVRVNYVEQAHEVALVSKVSSDAGSVQVKHHRNYEGRFDLQSDVGSVRVVVPPQSQKTYVVEKDEKSDWTGRRLVGHVALVEGGSRDPTGTSTVQASLGSIDAAM